MKVLLPNEITQRMITALKKAGHREIGGILMGEHVAENVYRVKDITIQPHGGRFASFIRAVKDFIAPLRRFFLRTGQNFTKFNYLGEWHSHPSFALKPSSQDEGTMWNIVNDPRVGANFAILIIVRLDVNGTDRLAGNVTVYIPGQQTFAGELIEE